MKGEAKHSGVAEVEGGHTKQQTGDEEITPSRPEAWQKRRLGLERTADAKSGEEAPSNWQGH